MSHAGRLAYSKVPQLEAEAEEDEEDAASSRHHTDAATAAQPSLTSPSAAITVFSPHTSAPSFLSPQRAPLRVACCAVLVVVSLCVFFSVDSLLDVSLSLNEQRPNPLAGPAASPAAMWWLHPGMSSWTQAALYSSTDPTASSSTPPPPSTAFYSLLLYDSFISLPALPTSSHHTRVKGSAAFRHVRLVNSRLIAHIPPQRPDEPLSTYDNDTYAYDGGSSEAGYVYSGTMKGLWEDSGAFYVGLQNWHNSTNYPIPSNTRSNSGDSSTAPQPPPRISASSRPSFSDSQQCHATQLDHKQHSHGRLLYTADHDVMRTRNTAAIRRLHEQSKRLKNGPSLLTSILQYEPHQGNTVSFDLSDSPVDYSDTAQCRIVVKHAYLVNQLVNYNYWHRFMDAVLPTFSLLTDPCFRSPTQHSPRSTRQSQSSEWSDDIVSLDSVVLVGDTRLSADVSAMMAFVTPRVVDNQPRQPGDSLPQHWSVTAALEQSGPLCFEELHVGYPWYLHPMQYPTDRVDPDRVEWEKHRLNEFVEHAESVIQRHRALNNTSLLTSPTKAELLVDADMEAADDLRGGFLRSLEANGVTDYTDGVSQLPDSEWWKTAPHLYYDNEPYEDWWRQQNELSGASSNDSSESSPQPSPHAYARHGRPFNSSEVADIADRIRSAVSWRSNTSLPVPSRRLRLLVAQRPQRGFAFPDLLASSARSAGFDVAVNDFSAARTLDDWHGLIEWIRSFDVILAPHGAGLTNVIWMLPNRPLLVELYPECWCHSHFTRFMYSRGLAQHAQVRTVNVGVPCMAAEEKLRFLQQCGRYQRGPPLNEQTLQQGLYTNVSTVEPAHVTAMATELLTFLHDHFLTMPMYSERLLTLPIIDQEKREQR